MTTDRVFLTLSTHVAAVTYLANILTTCQIDLFLTCFTILVFFLSINAAFLYRRSFSASACRVHVNPRFCHPTLSLGLGGLQGCNTAPAAQSRFVPHGTLVHDYNVIHRVRITNTFQCVALWTHLISFACYEMQLNSVGSATPVLRCGVAPDFPGYTSRGSDDPDLIVSADYHLRACWSSTFKSTFLFCRFLGRWHQPPAGFRATLRRTNVPDHFRS